MDRVEVANNMQQPGEAVRVARICNREAVLYSKSASPRAWRIAQQYQNERRFFMLVARGLKARSQTAS